MKSTGIVRKIDDLGRIVFPMELRRTMNLKPGDGMEIFTDGETIILRKYQPACIFCGEANEIVEHKGRKICKGCMEEIKVRVRKMHYLEGGATK